MGRPDLAFIYALALELSPDNFRLARNPETTFVHKLTHPSGTERWCQPDEGMVFTRHSFEN